MKRSFLFATSVAAAAAVLWLGSARAHVDPRTAQVARGKYLVDALGCADCHTPWTHGPNGPEPDSTRAYSGHPEDLVMPPQPALGEGAWEAVASASHTAWSGPWGVSFTANLTPDPDTGLGRWPVQTFVSAIRSGRHMGAGRPILPPMPYFAYANLTDEDLHAVFAYLQSLPPIRNRVPAPLPPLAAQ